MPLIHRGEQLAAPGVVVLVRRDPARSAARWRCLLLCALRLDALDEGAPETAWQMGGLLGPWTFLKPSVTILSFLRLIKTD